MAQTRRGHGYLHKLDDSDLLIIDFEGQAPRKLTAGALVQGVVSADPNIEIIEANAYRNEVTGGWRLALRFKRQDEKKPGELRAFLRWPAQRFRKHGATSYRSIERAACRSGRAAALPRPAPARGRTARDAFRRRACTRLDTWSRSRACTPLAAPAATAANPAHATIGARLRLAFGPSEKLEQPPVTRDVQGRERLETTPRLARFDGAARVAQPCVAQPQPETGRWRSSRDCAWSRAGRALEGSGALAHPRVAAAHPARDADHRPDGHRNRLHGAGPSLSWTPAARDRDTGSVRRAVRMDLGRILDCAQSFFLLTRHRDRYAIARHQIGDSPTDIPADARTAVVVPICNEDVRRVFAGLRATYESLAQTGALDRFDFYVLSDTGNADTRARSSIAGLRCAVPWTASIACSTGGASIASSARAATSPTSPPMGTEVPLHDRARRR